jgi:hypothetical protein
MTTWLGIALWGVVTWDLLMVTLGAAWRFSVTDRLGRAVFGLLRLLSRLGARAFLSELAGVVVMVAVAGAWILGYWIAWTLIYAGAAGAVEVTRLGREPEGVDLVAHVGHLLSTLGGATTEPSDGRWDAVGALVGLNGMLALTLSMSFLLGVRGTVQQGRAFAVMVATGEAKPGMLDPDVASLVAGLHAAPFALWFGHRRATRRLTRGLLDYARQAEREGGVRWARAKALLSDLPHLNVRAEDPDFLERLEGWALRHEVATDPSEGAGAAVTRQRG